MSTTRTHTNPELHGWKMPDDVQQNSPFYRFSRLFCRVTTSMLFKQRASCFVGNLPEKIQK